MLEDLLCQPLYTLALGSALRSCGSVLRLLSYLVERRLSAARGSTNDLVAEDGAFVVMLVSVLELAPHCGRYGANRLPVKAKPRSGVKPSATGSDYSTPFTHICRVVQRYLERCVPPQAMALQAGAGGGGSGSSSSSVGPAAADLSFAALRALQLLPGLQQQPAWAAGSFMKLLTHTVKRD